MQDRKHPLTEKELEIMEVVWRGGAVTVRDVYEEILTHRKVAYTTVMTVMKTLEKKGHLKVSQGERAYTYSATRPKNQVIKGMVREFVERVFHGSTRPLLVHLLEDQKLSEADLKEIARLTGKEK